MTITTTGLTRAAGVSAAVGGAIFIAVQINHPAMDVASVATTEWVVRNSAKALMAVLTLVGITGMYLRQVRQVGVLGLVGYVLLSLGYLLMLSIEVVAAAVLPLLTDIAPGLVDDVVVAAAGGHAAGSIGGIQTVLNLMGIGYMLGGLIFGVALFRAGVLARWASALLAVATVSTALLAVLPEAFNRPLAVPTGIALIGLGLSLARTPQDETTATVVDDAAAERLAVR